MHGLELENYAKVHMCVISKCYKRWDCMLRLLHCFVCYRVSANTVCSYGVLAIANEQCTYKTMVAGYSVCGSHQTCGYFDLAPCDVV